MGKVMKCREAAGIDCDFVARGANEAEVLAKAAEHAKKDHGMTEIPAELLAKAKSVIRDE